MAVQGKGLLTITTQPANTGQSGSGNSLSTTGSLSLIKPLSPGGTESTSAKRAT
jgi:hypothetical protein